MKLPWRQPPEPVKPAAGNRADAATDQAQSCPSLVRCLESAFRKAKPEILDLGPLCGDSVVFLADKGARVSVEEMDPLPPRPPAGSDEPAPEPFKVDHPDAAFDVVLAWEQFDFVPPNRMDEFMKELQRVIAPGGWLMLFSLNRPNQKGETGRPGRYRILADNRIQREETSGAPLERWVHPTRDIERALAPLSVQKLHLHRNQMREFLALKPTKKS